MRIATMCAGRGDRAGEALLCQGASPRGLLGLVLTREQLPQDIAQRYVLLLDPMLGEYPWWCKYQAFRG